MSKSTDDRLRATRKAVTNKDGTIRPAHAPHWSWTPAKNALNLAVENAGREGVKAGNLTKEDTK